jgi:hypothetical protein
VYACAWSTAPTCGGRRRRFEPLVKKTPAARGPREEPADQGAERLQQEALERAQPDLRDGEPLPERARRRLAAARRDPGLAEGEVVGALLGDVAAEVLAEEREGEDVAR